MWRTRRNFRQNAQRPKGVPLGLLFGPLCCDVTLYFSHTPSIQDGTGHWDGVDRLDPSRALGAVAPLPHLAREK